MASNENYPANPVSKINWAKVFSPCIFGIIVCITAIISSQLKLEETGGGSLIAIIVAVPILVALIVVYIVVKLIIRKALYVWLAELVAMSIIVFITLSTVD